jgi:2-methylcitrate dehydratase PrpD
MDAILDSLTDFATTHSYRDLPSGIVTAARQRLTDALGCAIGSYESEPAAIARAVAGPAARGALAGRIVGSKVRAAADAAGFANTCMIRNLDFNDTFLPGGHPSDCAGALFAVAPEIGASGERLIAATVVAYETFIRLQLSAKLRERGWDQGFGIGVGTAAGLSNLMGLEREAARHAMQSAIWAGIELRRKVSADQLASIDVQTSWHAWHESGSEPAKWDPQTKETADHSLPYILAWTLLHGDFTERAFLPESYRDPSIRPLMKMITVRVDEGIEKDMPRVVRMRVNAVDRSGAAYEVESVNPPGHEDNPLSVSDLAAKFTRLCEPRLGPRRTAAALEQWQNIETAMDLNPALDAVAIESAGGDSG